MLGNAVFYMTTMEDSFGQLNDAVSTLIRHEQGLSDVASRDAHTLAVRNKITIVLALLAALATAGASAWLLASAMRAEFDKKRVALLRAHDAIEEASLTDALTGMRNRRFVEQQMDADISLCLRRYRQWRMSPGSPAPSDADTLFFMVDIDHFKSLNDTLGHAAGDKVLSQVKARLKQACRESDYLVRWGGEEFLVVARGGCRTDGPHIAERIRAAVNDRGFDIGAAEPLSKSCSVGFAAFPFLASTPEALGWRKVVELADQALYIAKRGGRNAWIGLAADERTSIDSVRKWLAEPSSSSASDANLRIVAAAARSSDMPATASLT
jgi:diguanylate cyclase (GGDEF)-like protein